MIITESMFFNLKREISNCQIIEGLESIIASEYFIFNSEECVKMEILGLQRSIALLAQHRAKVYFLSLAKLSKPSFIQFRFQRGKRYTVAVLPAAWLKGKLTAPRSEGRIRKNTLNLGCCWPWIQLFQLQPFLLCWPPCYLKRSILGTHHGSPLIG